LSDKLLIRSNSPEAENKNTSAKSENDKSTYNNVNLGLNDISKKQSLSWKYFKMEKVSETGQDFNAICNVNDNTGKKCNTQLKVSRG
ncbi:852_t:CDS:1, partial [Gigaspora rosea]